MLVTKLEVISTEEFGGGKLESGGLAPKQCASAEESGSFVSYLQISLSTCWYIKYFQISRGENQNSLILL